MAACVLMVAATACAEEAGNDTKGAIPRNLTTAPVQESDDGNGGVATVNNSKLESMAIDALAAKLSIPTDNISMVSMTARDWPDSSLGCPQRGVSYIQVITPGYQATLLADGKTYSVHMTSKHAMVCQAPALAPLKRPAPKPQNETE
jgi:hypothetical protein